MQIITKFDPAFWWAVARACPYATFFHTPLWQDLALGTFPDYRDATIGAVLPSGVRVVLPLLSVRRFGPWHDLHSSAALCYGGPIADGPLTDAELRQVYRAACRWRTLRLQLTSNPLANASDPPGFSALPDYTHILRLDTDFATTFAGFSKNHQTHYRRGLRKGVQVRVATSLDAYRDYYQVYQDSLRRWHAQGTPLAGWEEPWRRFEVGASLAQRHPEALKLWVAEADGKLISGAWVFYWNGHAVYWHGATLEAYFDWYPSIVIHTEVIRDALERGYKRYDFNPSGNLAGVTEFKRRFGAEQRPVMRWTYGDAKFRLVRSARERLKTTLGRTFTSRST
jgi:hypothetical protein